MANKKKKGPRKRTAINGVADCNENKKISFKIKKIGYRVG